MDPAGTSLSKLRYRRFFPFLCPQLGFFIAENEGLFFKCNRWLFLVPIKGGRWHIIPQLAVYTIIYTHILPIGGLYATYHLLWEPKTTIDTSLTSATSIVLKHHHKSCWKTYQVGNNLPQLTNYQGAIYRGPITHSIYNYSSRGPCFFGTPHWGIAISAPPRCVGPFWWCNFSQPGAAIMEEALGRPRDHQGPRDPNVADGRRKLRQPAGADCWGQIHVYVATSHDNFRPPISVAWRKGNGTPGEPLGKSRLVKYYYLEN